MAHFVRSLAYPILIQKGHPGSYPRPAGGSAETTFKGNLVIITFSDFVTRRSDVLRVIDSEKILPVIDQNPPQGTLVELPLAIQRSQGAGRHPSGLSEVRAQVVNWKRLNLCQSNSSANRRGMGLALCAQHLDGTTLTQAQSDARSKTHDGRPANSRPTASS